MRSQNCDMTMAIGPDSDSDGDDAIDSSPSTALDESRRRSSLGTLARRTDGEAIMAMLIGA